MKADWFEAEHAVFMNTPFSALQTIAAVEGKPLIISPNQYPYVAQALNQSGVRFAFWDIDPNGTMLPPQKGAEALLSDYAGVLPSFGSRITFWNSGAGYLDSRCRRPCRRSEAPRRDAAFCFFGD